MAKMMQFFSPIFAVGFAYGWAATLRHSLPQGPDVLPLSYAIAIQFISLALYCRSFVLWEDEPWYCNVMSSVSTVIVALFLFFHALPALLIYLVAGISIPYVICVLVFFAPFAVFVIGEWLA